MKANLKGIRFGTWLYFLLFSVSMLVILGLLLVLLIKPYYRQSRIETIDAIISSIEDNLIYHPASQKDVEDTSKIVVGNNVCALIFNENNKAVYASDSLGEMCMLNNKVSIGMDEYSISKDPYKFIERLKREGTVNLNIPSSVADIEMLLYGKMIRSDLANYYLVINTPLEPVESYVDFIVRQYSYVSIIIVAIAFFVAIILANRISSPIVKMKEEANKLAEGNYDVNFDTKSFSEINDLAKTLDDATEKLSKVNELRKDLVANVSHDIKTPLTMIKAYAEMIKDISGDDPVKRDEHLDVILNEVDYLTVLVSDMQELSKLQSGNIELNKDNFDLGDTTYRVIDLLRHLSEEKQIEIESDLKEVIVYADEVKISQVLYNFISNALKYSAAHTKIRVLMEDSEEEVRVSVIDQGDGISQDDLPYIWDRYNKINKNFDRKVDSTGLGLSIAKAILEAHGAKYGVTSKLKEGSTFYFILSKDYENEEE